MYIQRQEQNQRPKFNDMTMLIMINDNVQTHTHKREQFQS